MSFLTNELEQTFAAFAIYLAFYIIPEPNIIFDLTKQGFFYCLLAKACQCLLAQEETIEIEHAMKLPSMMDFSPEKIMDTIMSEKNSSIFQPLLNILVGVK